MLRRPREMAAVAPSSQALARKIVDTAQIAAGHTIVELGAGSGPFTRELVQRYPNHKLLVLEVGEDLAAGLRAAYPTATVVAGRAENLVAIAEEHGITSIDRVVSGLPWALWPEPLQATILDAIVERMSPEGRFVTLHYVHSRALGAVKTTRRLLRERFAEVSHTTPVWANIPPAYVHVGARPLRAS